MYNFKRKNFSPTKSIRNERGFSETTPNPTSLTPGPGISPVNKSLPGARDVIGGEGTGARVNEALDI